MKKAFLLMLATVLTAPATGFAEDVPMDTENWDVKGTGAFTEFQGQPAVFLNHGLAVLKDREFQDGVIEFDIAFSEVRGFMGINFRVRDGGAVYEDFYFRSHQSGNPDANQYTPAFNRLTGWQIYYGPQFSTPVDYTFDAWQHVKVLVRGDEAEFYLDSDEPFLHVDDLLTDTGTGVVSLSSYFAGAYFGNFKITETGEVTFKGEPVAFDPWPVNLVEAFEVAKGAVPSADLDGSRPLDPSLMAGREWVTLPVEKNGIANLARINGISDEAATTLVRVRVASDADQIKTLKFGYSDKVSVYLNGWPVAGGDNTYMTRDYRYLGTVGLFDEVYLPLKKGDNEIVFAITEAFGGWAVMARFPDMQGIKLVN